LDALTAIQSYSLLLLLLVLVVGTGTSGLLQLLLVETVTFSCVT
jgi:hypothetical protein